MKPGRRAPRLSAPAILALAVAALATLLVTAARAAVPPSVTIVREDASGITIEYAPPAPEIRAAGDPLGGARVVVPDHDPRGTPGAPDLPGTFLTLGVPFRGDARLTIESIEYAPLGTVAIAPVPAVTGTPEEPALSHRPDAAIYDAGQPFPSAPAELSEVSLVGPQRVRSLLLWPARWNPKTGALEAVTRLRARVDFPATRATDRIAAADVPAAPREGTESLLRALLGNYETARAFREAPRAGKARAARRPAGAEDGFTSSDDWLRIQIPVKGVYRVTYEELVSAGIANPSTAIGSTGSIRLYNGGGLELPEPLTTPRATWMRQIPLLVQDGGDGRFDPGDAIVFYALALNGFFDEFDPSRPANVHFASRYANANVYWLTWGGTFAEPVARMTPPIDASVVPGSGAVVASTFLFRTHAEQDIVEDYSRAGEDGYFWASFRGTSAVGRFFVSSSPGADVTQPAALRIRFFGHRAADVGGSGTYSGNADWNGISLGDSNFTWTSGGSQPYHYDFTGLLATGRNDTLTVRILGAFSQDVYLSWFELAYQRRYDALGEKSALFTSPADTGLVRYDIAGFSGTVPLLFDVTNPFDQKLITGWTLRGDTVSFERRESSKRRYALWDETALLAASEIAPFEIQNLRDPSIQADYLMIVPDVPAMQSAALPLRAHRARDFRVYVAPLAQVAAQFGWGIADPTALRDMIQYAVENWDEGRGPGAGVVPEYVLLVGDCTKDYRNLKNYTNRNLMPTHYRIAPDGSTINTFATDDWFTYLAQDTTGDGVYDVYDELTDLAIGRLPAGNVSVLQTLVDKILDYELRPELGDWRSKLLFIADDEMKGCPDREIASPCWDRAFYQRHTDAVEQAAALVPDAFDRVKVYMTEYPFGNAAEKPAAKQAYLRALKDGCLVSHYSGHGGFDKMADENIFFSSDADATKIQNGRRQFIYTAYSCSIGTYDLPSSSSISELLLKSAGGGAIAAFASSAPAFDEASSTVGRLFVNTLFVPPGAGEPPRIGHAVRLSKTLPAVFRSRTNDEKYVLLGDPALRVGIPKHVVRIDPRGPFESTKLDSVSGTVVADDSLATWFDGVANVTVEGVADTSGYFYFPPPESLPKRILYQLPGGTLYRGEVPVVDGRWKARFFVPADVRVGNLAVVRAYVSNGVTDGLGVEDSLGAFRTASPDSATAADKTGPEMRLSIDGRPHRPGMTILPTAQLSVSVSDPHGVNLQGDDDFFALSVTIDEGSVSERTLNLTSEFAYDAGRFDLGGLTIPLSSISPSAIAVGSHRLTIQSSDNLNNRSVLQADVAVVGVESTFQVTRAENYPNPFSERTSIHYTLTQNADVAVRIFTVNGRLIREFRDVPCGSVGENLCLEWDGLDQDGDEVANGLYFFKVIARSDDSDAEGEAIGKAVLIRE